MDAIFYDALLNSITDFNTPNNHKDDKIEIQTNLEINYSNFDRV